MEIFIAGCARLGTAFKFFLGGTPGVRRGGFDDALVFAVKPAELIVAQSQQRRRFPLAETRLRQRPLEKTLFQRGDEFGEFDGQRGVRTVLHGFASGLQSVARRGQGFRQGRTASAKRVKHHLRHHSGLRAADGAFDDIL